MVESSDQSCAVLGSRANAHVRALIFFPLCGLALIDLNAKAYNGDTALMIASQEGYQDQSKIKPLNLGLDI